MESKETHKASLVRGFSTRAIHVAQEPDPITGAVVNPVSISSTYAVLPGLKYIYSRLGHPTRSIIEEVVASLSHAKYCLASCSGVSAGSLITHILHPGDEIIACQDMYGGLASYFEKIVGPHCGCSIKFVDFNNKAELLAAFTPKTKLVWLESPTNPVLNVYDIAEIAGIAHEHNALLVFDNTFYSPYLQNPLDLGADIVLEAGTKYIGGHADFLMGFIVLNDEKLYSRFKSMHIMYGGAPNGIDCYLALRGIKTLSIRMEKCQENALKLAQFLEKSPHVEATFYPGLPSHQGYAINKKQARGTGGMVSFRLKGADLQKTVKFCQSLHLFSYAWSLGSIQGLVCIPAVFASKGATDEFKKKTGIFDNLIRVSVGIEDFPDILKDFTDAFSKLT
jgi:cystathionine gamma-lyase